MQHSLHRPSSQQTAVACVLVMAFVSACANRAQDCSYTLSCVGDDAGESGGDSEGGGSTSAGGTTSAGGNATGGITSACNSACTGANPVCNEPTKTCVKCLNDSQCSGAKPVCKTEESADAGTGSGTNVCVACIKNEHCAGTTLFCDNSKNVCVECLTNNDCPDDSASLCRTGTCSPCAANADCAHIAGKTVCDTTRSSASEADAGAKGDAGTGTGTGTGACVQCTGTDYGACGQSNGKNLVCDSLSNICSTKTQASAGLCQTCVSDAQCAAGEMCVEEMFNGSSVGYFCFFKQGATGAPASCFSNGRPYAALLKDAVSIDNQTADICSLRVSTCPALNEFSSKDCTAAGAANDQLCGVAPGVDSKCAATTATDIYSCTVTCLSDYDCLSGVTCSTTTNPRVCSFQSNS